MPVFGVPGQAGSTQGPFYHSSSGGTDTSEWYVASSVGVSGDGSSSSAFATIQEALNSAGPNDNIFVSSGTYAEQITTSTGGVTLQSVAGATNTIITSSGRVINIQHPSFTLQGFVVDGQYGADDAIRVEASTGDVNDVTFRNCEIRRAGRDGIDIVSGENILVDGCEIHHLLFSTGGNDAHGLAVSNINNLEVKNCEIYAFTGDGLQIDPNRSGFSSVNIHDCTLYLQTLSSENGTPSSLVGTKPGENAIDLKSDAVGGTPSIRVSSCVAHDFDASADIANRAAFNIKEKTDVVLDGNEVYDCQIAYRLRSPSTVSVFNALTYSCDKAVRIEDYSSNTAQTIPIYNGTFGSSLSTVFETAGTAPSSMLDIQNCLFSSALPAEATSANNSTSSTETFQASSNRDYRLTIASTVAIEKGDALSTVTTDIIGTARPQITNYDIGAYENTDTAYSSVSGGGGSSGNAYYSSLITSPGVEFKWSLRVSSQITDDSDLAARDPISSHFTIDFASDTYANKQDALRGYLSSGETNMRGPTPWITQNRSSGFNPSTGENLVVTFDVYFSSHWSKGDIGTIAKYKWYQLESSRGGDQRWIEPRILLKSGGDENLADVDARTYTGDHNLTDNDPVLPQASSFTIKANTWTRYWAEVTNSSVDYDGFSQWYADSNQGVVQVHSSVGINMDAGAGYKRFWYECNTSQDRAGSTGPLIFYTKNFVALKNVGMSTLLQAPVSS